MHVKLLKQKKFEKILNALASPATDWFRLVILPLKNSQMGFRDTWNFCNFFSPPKRCCGSSPETNANSIVFVIPLWQHSLKKLADCLVSTKLSHKLSLNVSRASFEFGSICLPRDQTAKSLSSNSWALLSSNRYTSSKELTSSFNSLKYRVGEFVFEEPYKDTLIRMKLYWSQWSKYWKRR